MTAELTRLCSVEISVDCDLFDHGGERNVFHAKVLKCPVEDIKCLSDRLKLSCLQMLHCVAKESRYIEKDDMIFHRKNLVAQFKASELVHHFNWAINYKAGYKDLPRVRYLDCYLCVCFPGDGRVLFLEEYLEGGKFKKWNSMPGTSKHLLVEMRASMSCHRRSRTGATFSQKVHSCTVTSKASIRRQR